MKHFILLIFVLLPFSVSSQLNETFSESELSSGWIGKDRDQFCINEVGQLQLNIKPTANGKASIGYQIPYASDMQWEFDVWMQYAPSDDNKLCVYLYQEDSEHYFYIRLGFDGRCKLGFRQQGNIDLFERQENPYQNVPLLLHLKMTLEKNETWTLYSRTEGMSGYKVEGTVYFPIKNPQLLGNMLFTFYYTKSRSTLFRIDNIRVSHQITKTPLLSEEEEKPDEPGQSVDSLPRLLEIEPLSPSILRFTFDKPVEIKGAAFSISDIGEAYQKSYVDEETKLSVNTLFEQEMELGKDYTISYTGLESFSGTLLPDYSVVWMLKAEETEDEDNVPATYSEGAVLINEIMADPKGLEELPETEYVELYNTTEDAIPLRGWQLVYGGSPKNIGEAILPAKGYAVLFRLGREISLAVSAVAVPMDKFPNALANTGKELKLLEPSGKIIDQVSYAKATAGKSWERSDEGWYLSSDPRGGTPGEPNSSPEQEEENPEEPNVPETPEEPQEPEKPSEPENPTVVEPVLHGEIVFNELLPNPYIGGSEYIELYNRSDKSLSVATLSLAVRKSDGTLNTRYPLSEVTEPLGAGDYLLLSKDIACLPTFYDIFHPSALWQLDKLPVLANTASTLVLFRTADGVVIDEVSYSSKWHAYSIKNEKGVALERIDPDGESQDESNWTSASALVGYGTPGYQNSQYLNYRDEESTGIEKPVWIEETANYRISYRLDRSGYHCRAYIFNTSGIQVAEVLNHELLGTSGEVSWDGLSHTGLSLPTGIYIFYAEIYHAGDGVARRYKKAFLVR